MKPAIILRGLQRFDEGTEPLILAKPIFVTLANALCNQAPPTTYVHRYCLNWPKFRIVVDSLI